MADKTMLNFKYGIFSRLPETQVPGTVYVTADEKAMYVDLPAVTAADGSTIAADRIRVSQIIVKNSSRDAVPPFSEDAFYYFVEENALLKWIPAVGDVAAHWKQINSVSDVTANLEALTQRVAANETSITTLNGTVAGHTTAIGENATAIAENKAAIESNDTDIKNLQDALAETNENVATNTTAIGDANSGLVKGVADNLSAINGLTTRIGTAETDIDNLEKAIGDASSGLVKDIADNRAAIEANDEDIAANAEAIEALQTAIGGADSGLIQTVNSHTTSINNLTTNKVDVTTYNEKVAEIEGDINDLEAAIGDATSGLIKDIADNKAAIEANDTDIATNADNIGKNATAIGNLQTDLGNLTTRVDTAEGEIDTLQTDLGNLTTRVGTAEGEIDTLQSEMDAVEKKAADNATNIGNNATAISGLTTRMGTAEDAIDHLEALVGTLPADATQDNVVDFVIAQMEAADAMHYIDGIDAYTDLPTTGVEAGDTYVVTGDFAYGGESYYAGDLLVAAADQGNADSYAGGWTHVKTGYQANQEAKLTGADNAIKLTSYTNVDLGTINVVAEEGSALTATVDNNTLTLGIEWGSF